MHTAEAAAPPRPPRAAAGDAAAAQPLLVRAGAMLEFKSRAMREEVQKLIEEGKMGPSEVRQKIKGLFLLFFFTFVFFPGAPCRACKPNRGPSSSGQHPYTLKKLKDPRGVTVGAAAGLHFASPSCSVPVGECIAPRLLCCDKGKILSGGATGGVPA